ncbi:YkgJ family cysteine cluster protein [Haloarcula montana]|uniref:YkgJ family cysteine cluster protein n=1 Tax=Haloarcula montana TaxID=3111776 RepID=UPI002D793952|nr:YkgJ family cysteine cluster protein [Haloarcula sp. GH36]
MESLESELDRARELDVADLADAIESIGFECTRCGACCTADAGCGSEDESGATDDPHTATVFPDEIRRLQASGDTDYDFRDVARPMPYGLTDGPDGPEGETFEWALQTDDCGDCTFYEETDGTGACTVHEDRPLICRTYPFSVALGGTTQPMGDAVDEAGMVRAHECEGLGREIDREDAEELAAALKERAVRELEEAIGVREQYQPVETGTGEVVVHDSEGQKRPDGTHRE